MARKPCATRGFRHFSPTYFGFPACRPQRDPAVVHRSAGPLHRIRRRLWTTGRTGRVRNRAASKAAATSSSRRSAPNGATIWTPTGRPSAVVAGRHRDRRAAGDGDDVAPSASSPGTSPSARPLIVGGVLLVGRERRHLRGRQHQHVVRLEERAHPLGQRGALRRRPGRRRRRSGASPARMLSASDCLNAVGVAASSAPKRGLEEPGAQGPEGVLGLGEVGVGRLDVRAGGREARRPPARPRRRPRGRPRAARRGRG